MASPQGIRTKVWVLVRGYQNLPYPFSSPITLPTTSSKSSSSQSTVISAIFSYIGTLCWYMSGRLWPAMSTMPRVVMLLSLRTISSQEIFRYMATPSFFRESIAFLEKTTLPPVAMTQLRQWRDRMVSSSIFRNASGPSVSMISCRSRPARSWIAISVSTNVIPSVFARMTPTVLFPAPGMPISMMFFMGVCCLLTLSCTLSLSLVSRIVCKDPFQFLFERRDIHLDDRPDLIRINRKIVMDKNIPESNDPAPGDQGKFSLGFFRDPTGGFPENLEIINNPDLDELVTYESLFS